MSPFSRVIWPDICCGGAILWPTGTPAARDSDGPSISGGGGRVPRPVSASCVDLPLVGVVRHARGEAHCRCVQAPLSSEWRAGPGRLIKSWTGWGLCQGAKSDPGPAGAPNGRAFQHMAIEAARRRGTSGGWLGCG
jgi:hypothetical protein